MGWRSDGGSPIDAASAREEAFHEAIIDFPASQFGKLPEGLEQKVGAVTDMDFLKRLVRRAGVVGSVEEFESELG